jgi:hypothetical protein
LWCVAFYLAYSERDMQQLQLTHLQEIEALKEEHKRRLEEAGHA